MIEVEHLKKVYGSTVAVDDLSFTVRPGLVTGFLGPNGAGKSTTMRMIVGLDHPTRGEARIAGRRYADHPDPLHQVGALLDARAFAPGRRAATSLRALATSNGIPRRRVQEVLDLVGLHDAADRRTGGFSLGMAQRLGLAAALLGDPAVLLLDEPVNGLDPDGIRWIRTLLRSLAAEGRTVLVSSHLMSEMALTADHLVVVGRGRLLADVSMAELTASAAPVIRVSTPAPDVLRPLLTGPDVTVASSSTEPDVLTVTGLTGEAIARTALEHHVLVHGLTPEHRSLEDAYLALTAQDVEFRAPRTSAQHDTDPRRAAA
jgi:ABC-2 type transport system ATP-binding protein